MYASTSQQLFNWTSLLFKSVTADNENILQASITNDLTRSSPEDDGGDDEDDEERNTSSQLKLMLPYSSGSNDEGKETTDFVFPDKKASLQLDNHEFRALNEKYTSTVSLEVRIMFCRYDQTV